MARSHRLEAHAATLRRLKPAEASEAVPGPGTSDPVANCEAMIDPETGRPFLLYEEQRAFIRAALTLTEEGRLPYPEMVFGAPKKSGKTALAAMVAILVARDPATRFAEVFAYANDLEQSVGRVFQAAARIVEATPWLQPGATIQKERIIFAHNGGIIQAMSFDAASAAGSNPSLSVFDELWAFSTERGHRLWDEAVPSPARRVSGRLTVTYAGYEGESEPLESLYRRGVAGDLIAPDLYRIPGQLTFWTHRHCAPWQTGEWRAQMRQQLRASAYARLIENRWTSGESELFPLEWWDACVDPELRPALQDQQLSVFIGVDASTKRDSTALVAVTFDRRLQRVRLVRHVVFQPSPDQPLDFEATVERVIRQWAECYTIRDVRYDPYQMVASAQRLRSAGIRMTEFPQSVPNLTEASSNFYELVKGRNLQTYPDAQLRQSVSQAVAIEMPRGWRIAKTNRSHKIDVVVALAMASLAASKEGTIGPTRRGTFVGGWGGFQFRFGSRMGNDQEYPSRF